MCSKHDTDAVEIERPGLRKPRNDMGDGQIHDMKAQPHATRTGRRGTGAASRRLKMPGFMDDRTRNTLSALTDSSSAVGEESDHKPRLALATTATPVPTSPCHGTAGSHAIEPNEVGVISAAGIGQQPAVVREGLRRLIGSDDDLVQPLEVVLRARRTCKRSAMHA